MLLMWLGELVTEQGLGNGISLLITVSIVSRLPQTISEVATSLFSVKGSFNLLGLKIPVDGRSIIFAVVTLFIVLLVTWLVVKLN